MARLAQRHMGMHIKTNVKEKKKKTLCSEGSSAWVIAIWCHLEICVSSSAVLAVKGSTIGSSVMVGPFTVFMALWVTLLGLYVMFIRS